MTIRKPKTYDTIVAPLNKLLDELVAYTEEQTALATEQRRVAEELQRKADAADAEAAKAQFTREKLAGLLS